MSAAKSGKSRWQWLSISIGLFRRRSTVCAAMRKHDRFPSNYQPIARPCFSDCLEHLLSACRIMASSAPASSHPRNPCANRHRCVGSGPLNQSRQHKNPNERHQRPVRYQRGAPTPPKPRQSSAARPITRKVGLLAGRHARGRRGGIARRPAPIMRE